MGIQVSYSTNNSYDSVGHNFRCSQLARFVPCTVRTVVADSNGQREELHHAVRTGNYAGRLHLEFDCGTWTRKLLKELLSTTAANTEQLCVPWHKNITASLGQLRTNKVDDDIGIVANFVQFAPGLFLHPAFFSWIHSKKNLKKKNVDFSRNRPPCFAKSKQLKQAEFKPIASPHLLYRFSDIRLHPIASMSATLGNATLGNGAVSV